MLKIITSYVYVIEIHSSFHFACGKMKTYSYSYLS
jgi:hypothetical protein